MFWGTEGLKGVKTIMGISAKDTAKGLAYSVLGEDYREPKSTIWGKIKRWIHGFKLF
jgi:hypothetical protein